jgi:tryptophan 7-halogenase
MSTEAETKAEAFRGATRPEGIVLEFGCLAAPRAHGATTIALTDRVLMPLETAQRLMLALQSLQRSGAATPASTTSPVAAAPSRGEVPVNAPPQPAGEKAALLMRLVSALGVPFEHERSFRLSEGELLANRFLLTVDRDRIGEGRIERVLAICRELGLPSSLERDIAGHFDHARSVHFGFEAGAGSMLCKLYLERELSAGDLERARADAQPIALHLAFKWNVLGPGHVVSRYLWHPALSMTGIEERLGVIYTVGRQDVSLDIARAILRFAASRTQPERLQYLEVLEDENDRRSFDLNLYPAGLQVKDIQHLLSRMRAHYGIRPGQFQALFDQVKAKTLGHVAGGVHRNGRDFFNIYYGVEGEPARAGGER